MFSDPNLRALAAILRTGSFEAAARDEGVSPAAISIRLKALEDRTGTLLVNRSRGNRGPCTGTEAGLRLLRHADAVALLEAELAQDLPSLGPAATPHVRIAVNADSLATWVLPALAQIKGMVFDLVVDDQDHSANWLTRGAVLGAISATRKPGTGTDGYALGRLRYRATASPAFMKTHFFHGVTVETMAKAPSLQFDTKDTLQSQWARLALGDHARPGPAHQLPSTHGFVDACLAGLGWGLNPEPLVTQALRNRHLVELRPGVPLDTRLYWHVSRLHADLLAPLTLALRKTARARLLEP
ncbi:LysR family transcriptional regulator ArgP [Tropicimonas sp. S265A]|uniref:LysR family transcriptional regulator ArgP n=1 Tax=Tropicimonas sp. S265A TaxID=3415134 RepID=UPI003C7D28DD